MIVHQASMLTQLGTTRLAIAKFARETPIAKNPNKHRVIRVTLECSQTTKLAKQCASLAQQVGKCQVIWETVLVKSVLLAK